MNLKSKKGFTLVELLAVIIILAVISTIVVPIVLNIVNDSKKSTYESSIALYGKAVKQAILNYELDKKVTPTTFNQIKPYLEFEGNNVECNTKIIYDDGEIYLKDCSVDGNLVEDYTYGKRTLSDTILKHATDNNYYYKTKPDFTKATEDGEFGLYVAKDDLGDSYYFRGDVENNYVQFGTWANDTSYNVYDYEGDSSYEGTDWENPIVGSKTIKIFEGTPMYWRIVRVNGDGTIRLIYDGVEKVKNGIEHTATIGISEYNVIGSLEGTNYVYSSEDSTIKTFVDKWYVNNLKNKYSSYISNSIFCNDTTYEIEEYYSENGDQASSDNYSYAYVSLTNSNRIWSGNPQLNCTNKNDRYTLMGNSLGNELLTYPIGLITSEEVVMAGSIVGYDGNTSFYLYSDEYFYTMSPADGYLNSGPNISWVVTVNGNLRSGYFDNSTIMDKKSVRPVINLKADVRFTGTGTIDDPYVIITD